MTLVCITWFTIRLRGAPPEQVAAAVEIDAPREQHQGEARCLALMRKMLTFLHQPFEEPEATALLVMIRPPEDIHQFVYELNSRSDALLRAYVRETSKKETLA